MHGQFKGVTVFMTFSNFSESEYYAGAVIFHTKFGVEVYKAIIIQCIGIARMHARQDTYGTQMGITKCSYLARYTST